MKPERESAGLFLIRLGAHLVSIPLDVIELFPFVAALAILLWLHGLSWGLVIAFVAGLVISVALALIPAALHLRRTFDQIYRFRRTY
jgi:hypothetical protein